MHQKPLRLLIFYDGVLNGYDVVSNAAIRDDTNRLLQYIVASLREKRNLFTANIFAEILVLMSKEWRWMQPGPDLERGSPNHNDSGNLQQHH